MNELQCVFSLREKVTNRTLTLDNVIKTELYHEIRQISIVETIINDEGTVNTCELQCIALVYILLHLE